MNPTELPIARVLFKQWQRLRGNRSETASVAFSRDFETLLEDAGLITAIDRTESETDLRALESGGWLKLTTVRYKQHLIHKVKIPLEQEERWRQAFGFISPSQEEARMIQDFPWVPELEFIRTANLNLPFEELQKLNGFLSGRQNESLRIPIKERSIQLFGDEKRLDALLSSSLFRPGRLDLLLHLRCEIVGVPLGWKRGPATAQSKPVIVIENAATWHSFCQWNQMRCYFSAVVYGDGNRFIDSTESMRNIFSELGGARPIQYFGDIDPHGVRIPQLASKGLQSKGLPRVEPHLWSYRKLFALCALFQPCEKEAYAPELCDWLADLSIPARRLFDGGYRLAQERLGWEILSQMEAT